MQLEQARARDALRKDVGHARRGRGLEAAEREIDPKAHADLIETARHARSKAPRPDGRGARERVTDMAERATVARPYAKAAFAYAREAGRARRSGRAGSRPRATSWRATSSEQLEQQPGTSGAEQLLELIVTASAATRSTRTARRFWRPAGRERSRRLPAGDRRALRGAQGRGPERGRRRSRLRGGARRPRSSSGSRRAAHAAAAATCGCIALSTRR